MTRVTTDAASVGYPHPEPDPQPQPPKLPHTPLIIRVAVVVLVAAGIGMGLGLRGSAARPAKPAAPSAAPFTLHGTVLIVALLGIQDMDNTICTGTGDYRDIGTGTQVVVTDQSGAKLGATQLGV